MIKKIAIVSLGLLPLLAFAAASSTPPEIKEIGSLSDYSGIIDLINRLASWMLGILIAIATAFFVYAGFLYLMSAGDEEKLKAARNYIIYGVIAIAVGLLSKTIIALLNNFLRV